MYDSSGVLTHVYMHTDLGNRSAMSLDLPLLMSRSRLLGSVASSAPRLLNMITKPDNLSRRTKSFHLSCLDQHIVRVYIQTLCIFPVREPE